MLFGIYLEDTWKRVDGNHNYYGEKDWVYSELASCHRTAEMHGLCSWTTGTTFWGDLEQDTIKHPKHCFLEANKGYCAQSLKKMLMTYQSQHPTASPGIPKMYMTYKSQHPAASPGIPKML